MLITWLRRMAILVVMLGALGLLVGLGGEKPLSVQSATAPLSSAADDYIVLSWNDLGMHCYNRDFQDLAVLPPYNTLWAQVIRKGDPPQIVTTGITVTYGFPDNTYSVGKTNFWDYDIGLFGVDLPPNVGLAGNGLSGAMAVKTDHFEAVGIPLTEYRDSALYQRYPYQLAEIIVHDAGTGAELTRATVVAPVSTEMRCDNCHKDGGVEGIATGRVETNILAAHDEEGGDAALAASPTSLMLTRPVLCASCHSSNALGTPGTPGVDSLSRSMHEKHAEEFDTPNTTEDCYNCHPGPTTLCLRDVMSQKHGMGCVDCHGGMKQVAENPSPWLNEPRCDTCHEEDVYKQDQALYRNSSGHGGVYCAGCHDSPHAIAPSREPNDALKFIELQGHSGALDTCTVCHLTMPAEDGPHGLAASDIQNRFFYVPFLLH